MRWLYVSSLSALFAAATACSTSADSRCKEVCARETECVEELGKVDENLRFDFDECVAGCLALERDAERKKLVDKHIECTKAAGSDCQKLMNCR